MRTRDNLANYQVSVVDRITNLRKLLVMVSMGGGKTACTLTAIEHLINSELAVEKVLIIAPPLVAKTVWHEEAGKWLHTKGLTFQIIAGTPAQREKQLKNEANIYLISNALVDWLCERLGKDVNFDMLVIDEISRFKNSSSVRFKKLKSKIQLFKNGVVGLTGTPTPKDLIDIWSQVYLIDQGERLGKNITAFRAKYFNTIPTGIDHVYNYTLKQGAFEQITAAIADVSISVPKEVLLKTAGVRVIDVKVELPAKVMQLHKRFEKSSLLPLPDGTNLLASSAGVKHMKLIQLANGIVYDEKRRSHVFHDAKLEAIKELVEQALGQPVVICYVFEHDKLRLLEAFKHLKVSEFNGADTVREWNNGEIDILLAHPASVGHGLELQHGGHILIWYNLTEDAEIYQQMNQRLDRPSQQHMVLIYRLVAMGTRDETTVKRLDGKSEIQNKFVKDLEVK